MKGHGMLLLHLVVLLPLELLGDRDDVGARLRPETSVLLTCLWWTNFLFTEH